MSSDVERCQAAHDAAVQEFTREIADREARPRPGLEMGHAVAQSAYPLAAPPLLSLAESLAEVPSLKAACIAFVLRTSVFLDGGRKSYSTAAIAGFCK